MAPRPLVTHGLSSFWEDLVSAGDDLDRLVELIVRRVAAVVGEGSVLTTVSEDGQRLEPGAVFHADPDVRAFMRSVLAAEPYPIGEGVAGAVATRREPAIVSGFDDDRLGDEATPHTLRFVERYPIRSLAIVPMIAFGEVVGTLGAVRMESRQPYVDEDVMVLEALAERAALAVADAKGRPRRLGPADYEAMFRQSVDGVLFTVPDGRILAANPAACAILQRTEVEICRAGRAGILVDDEATRASIAQRAIQGNTRAEVRMRRGGGEEFTADLSSTIFTTASGEVRAAVIFRDITSSVRSRVRLARQHRDLTLLHRVTNAINDAADLDDAIQHTLDLLGEALGWPLGDALLLTADGTLRPSPAMRITEPERFTWFREWLRPVTPADDERLAGRVVTTLDGVWESDLPESAVLARSRGEAPSLRSYVGVPIMVGSSVRGVLELFSDATMPRDDGLLSVLVDLGTQLGRALERTEAEAAHRLLDEERTAFVARAAHELRSPVAALALAVGLLEGREAADETGRQLLAVVVDSTRHLERLVSRLLDLSRIEHGIPEISLEAVEPSQVLARALAAELVPVGRTVTADVPTELRVRADELALGQVVTNLLANAFRYGGEHVTVGARRRDDVVEVTVADDGPGVDPALEATLFTPFARGAGGEGIGLGLAISRRLVEAMGGSLRHERPEGGGCRFVVTLPSL